jgi:hypothetical protein
VQLYRTTLIVRNRATVAHRCSVRIADSALARLLSSLGTVDISPDGGYVQARDVSTGVDGAFAFSLRFTPSLAVLQEWRSHLARVAVDPTEVAPGLSAAFWEGVPLRSASGSSSAEVAAGGVMQDSVRLTVPFHIVDPDIRLPSHFAVTAVVTSPMLQVTPQALSFGAVPTGQVVALPLTVTNLSLFPQQYAVPAPSRSKVRPASNR